MNTPVLRSCLKDNGYTSIKLNNKFRRFYMEMREYNIVAELHKTNAEFYPPLKVYPKKL
jgi:hypothetical protein